ncbi:hypothetical protein [Microbacterium sp. NPDC058345]|uniref:hypothetical protein n=1 Tax=Microbacterium sp. NPDC058345 TaxID=3346455 RepID=UPI00365EA65D
MSIEPHPQRGVPDARHAAAARRTGRALTAAAGMAAGGAAFTVLARGLPLPVAIVSFAVSAALTSAVLQAAALVAAIARRRKGVRERSVRLAGTIAALVVAVVLGVLRGWDAAVYWASVIGPGAPAVSGAAAAMLARSLWWMRSLRRPPDPGEEV